MSAFQIELSEKEWEIVEEVWDKVQQEIAYLATLNREERLAFGSVSILALSVLSGRSAAPFIPSTPISMTRPLNSRRGK